MSEQSSNKALSFDAGKTYLIKGSTLRRLCKAVNEWSSLVVQWGPASGAPAIARGETKSILTIPQWAGSGGDGQEPKTFFCTKADAGGTRKVAITRGAISTIPCSVILISGVADGDDIYLDVTFNSYGQPVAVTISKGSVPASTTSHGYALLATVAVVDGATKVYPVGWNYSQAKLCGNAGSSTFYEFW